MPYINVKTNSPSAIENREIIKQELGKAIEAIPGKSEGWLMINVDEPSFMAFKGDTSPCAMFEVSIFGSADGSAYSSLTEKLCSVAEEYLGVPASRTYIKYSEHSEWGWNNMNF